MPKILKSISFYIVLIVAVLLLWNLLDADITQNHSFSELINWIENEKVEKLVIEEQQIIATMREDGREVVVPVISSSDITLYAGEIIKDQISDNSLQVEYAPPEEMPFWLSILPTLLIVVVVAVFWFIMMQQAQGGGGGRMSSFGKSRARKMSDSGNKKTFADVAGAEEEKHELKEIVDFLKAPKRFLELGARIPKGVLLVGPPGTGKTLLAKAVAGEAGVAFFSISGSDFVEMFVGVGASRVRDLFAEAKKNLPCIIFIDEIDAVGRHRGAGLGGGHDEREQTLNQLLVEMDGFGANEGIIIIAATNRPDILDPALLRPGRFDRQVVVDIPDAGEREAILKVHAKGKPFATDVNLKDVAKGTTGFTGADLENLLNESAILAARNKQDKISKNNIDEALIKVIAGPEKANRIRNEKAKRLTAFHEAGHALIAKLLPTQDPVHQISIIPRGRAGGYTMSLPKEDKFFESRQDMLEDIVALLGGRVAEKLELDDISTGASNDMQRATAIARDMVTKYGMSEKLGPMTFGSPHDEVFVGRDYAQQAKNYSEKTAADIDAEITAIIQSCYGRCEELLTENIEKLRLIANTLLEKEKIDGEEFELLFADVNETEETQE
ncbi:MAG: ATP-dependent zinc metalloprotease FtsH [Clostridia bacterium]|nr:ATP-dependent zinc metalloprotease FtsH [Clostridia bacterium]